MPKTRLSRIAFIVTPQTFGCLTLDMSGDRRHAKHAGGRPLDGRVRRLMEHGLVASHERQFATQACDRQGASDRTNRATSALRHEAQTMRSSPGTSRRLVPLLASEHREAVRLRTAAEPHEWCEDAALKRSLNTSAQRASTAPNRTAAKPAMSATRTTRMRAAVPRRSPQDERPAPPMANSLVRGLHCCEGRRTCFPQAPSTCTRICP